MNTYDSEIEEAIISACLIDQTAIPLVINRVKPKMFYLQKHSVIYETLLQMFNDGKAIDLVTVKDELLRKGKLEEIGGAVYICQLSSKTASSAHLEYHALILLEYFMRRMISLNLSKLINAANDMTTDIYDTVGNIQTFIDNMVKDGGYDNHARNMDELITDTLKQANERIANNKNGITGIPTGIESLDQITCGLQNGDLIVIAARPSVGKSAFAIHLALAAAKASHPVVFFSLEMTGERICDRILVSTSGISAQNWRSGIVSEFEQNQVKGKVMELRDYPIIVDDNLQMGMDVIRARAKLYKAQNKCSMIIIDYLQLSKTVQTGYHQNREHEVAELSQKAKQIAKELNIPVIVLSQLNRESENRPGKRPQLADLRESGSIEQDADVVILIQRPELERIGNKRLNNIDKHQGTLIVAKQRNGPTGDVYFGHNDSMTQIGDYVPDSIFD